MSQVECRLDLGFDAIEYGLYERDQCQTESLARIEFTAGSMEAAEAALRGIARQLATANKLKRVHVQIEGRWLRWINLPWSISLSSPMTAQDACRLQLQLSYNEGQSLQFAIGSAPYGAGRVAVGISEYLLKTLRDFAGQARLSIAPATDSAFLATLAATSAQKYGLLVCEAGVLTCFLINDGVMCRVHAQAMPAEGMAGLFAVWQRLQLRDEAFSACEQIYVMDLTGGNTLPEAAPALMKYLRPKAETLKPRFREVSVALNFMPVHRSWLSWRGVSALAGLLLLIAAGALWWSAQQAISQAQLQVASQAAHVVQLVSPPMPKGEQNIRNGQLQIKAVNAAVRQLNAPVGNILQSIRPDRASDITLLKLHFKAASRQLSVEGLAPTAEAMTAYVSAVGQKPVFVSAWLSHHEMDGESGYRFTVDASWQE